jgi:hypothetical protein
MKTFKDKLKRAWIEMTVLSRRIRAGLRLAILFLLSPAALILVGCGTDAEEKRREQVSKICEFDRNRPNTLISHVDANGAVVYGDINNSATGRYESIASVIAAAEKLYARTRSRPGVRFNCVSNGFQYWCGPMPGNFSDKVETSSVYGIGRASDLRQARKLALDNCKAIASSFAEENDIASYKIDCKVIASQLCY